MTDEEFEKVEAFLAEFKALVRKYVPDYNGEESVMMLMWLQEKTSVYNPYIWSNPNGT